MPLTEHESAATVAEDPSSATMALAGAPPNTDEIIRDPGPLPVTLEERIRRLPGAVLLTLGYFASRLPRPRRWH